MGARPELQNPSRIDEGNASESSAANAADARVEPWSLYTDSQRWTMLIVLFLIIVSNYCDSLSIAVLLEPIRQEFKVSDTLLGLLSGFSLALFGAVLALPVARLADHGNRRTILVFSLIAWSTLTTLCGRAKSFSQLVLIRFGVGAAASGALPPAQSLVADYFPPEQRAAALGVLTAAMNVGLLVGIGLCGYIAASLGWRAALILVGAPGIGLALLARFALAEPRRRLGFPGTRTQPEPLSQTIRSLRSKRSYLYLIFGFAVYCIFAFGLSTFLPSYMIRTLHASLRQASTVWGMAIAGANVMGSIAGGWFTDALSRRNVKWYGWLPALTCTVGAGLYWLAFSVNDFWTFISVEFVAETALAIASPGVFAAVHSVCGHRRRSMAVGLLLLLMMIFGNGLGPLTVGLLSDALSPKFGAESLRYSLVILVVLTLPAATAYYLSARTIPHDLE